MIICFNKISGICIFVVVVLAVLVSGWGSTKVPLKDVQVLTLHAGQHTTSRRGAPVPQLNCLGGSAGCKDAPDVVQCRNVGSDGSEVQWECKAQMAAHTKFGRLSVNCERYNYPGDKDILIGSCGLEYYLERSKGKSSHKDRGYSSTQSSSRLSSAVGIAIILLVIYAFYRSCLHTDEVGYSRPQPRSGAGFRSGVPPPAGIRSGYYAGSDGCSGNRSGANSGGAGFWTGAAGGGLLGYLFGRNSGGGYTQSYNQPSRSRNTSSDRSTNTATGYCGTKVR